MAAVDEMGLKTKKPQEKLSSWLASGKVADVGEGWQRLLEMEEEPVKRAVTLKQVWEAGLRGAWRFGPRSSSSCRTWRARVR